MTMLRSVYVFILLTAGGLYTCPANAYFKFQSADPPKLNWTPGTGNILLKIPVRFSTGNRGNGTQYVIALSDGRPTAPTDIDTPTVSYIATRLKEMLASVQWRQGGKTITFNPGLWTAPPITKSDGPAVGELRLEFRREALLKLSSGQHLFDFWISGRALSGTQRFDSIYVQVNIIIPHTVRISRLKDVTIPYSDAQVRWLWKNSNFCVFASSGSYFNISFDSQHADPDNGWLMLRSESGHNLHYWISLRQRTTRWKRTKKVGRLRGHYHGDPAIDCRGLDNMIMRVEISNRELHSVPADTYTDVLTITVRAS